MKKFKINSLFVVSLVLPFAFSIFAFSAGVSFAKQNDDLGEIQQQNQQQTQTMNQGEDTQIQTQTQNMEQVENENDGEEGSDVDNQVQQQVKAKTSDAEEYRNNAAKIVKTLIDVANRGDNGIGDQVRLIAQQQNESASTTVRAMGKVQEKSKWKTFFFGSDYKNLGALRSEMVQTENRMEQLNRLMESTQNEGDKIELQNQVQALQQEQQKIETFVKASESKFSLLGWFVKLFVK